MPFISSVYYRRLVPWLLGFFFCCGFAAAQALDLNRATLPQLLAVKGIGDKLADRILAAREKGRFVSMEDFADRVAGVGPKTLRTLREQGVGAGTLAERSVQRQPIRSGTDNGQRAGRSGRKQATAMPARRNRALRNETATDLRHRDDSQAGRPVPAMPMLIAPRPRPVNETPVR